MPIQVTMPRLSDTMEEGTLLKWRVKAGDKVTAGDILADVETDKATMELSSYEDGTVAKLVADEGATLPVGGLILVLAKPGESMEDAAQSAGSAAPAAKAKAKQAADGGSAADRGGGAATAVAEAPPAGKPGDGRVRVSPLANRMAADAGVDVSKLAGSGPGGRVIKRDIEAAIAGAPTGGGQAASATVDTKVPPSARAMPLSPAPRLESKLVPVSNMRKTIARRLVESKQTIPHFTVTIAADIEPLMALRETINSQLENQGVKLSVNDFIVRAVALALTRHPVVNSSWTDQGIQFHGQVNVGVAVALPQERGGGLVVPTLRDAAAISLRQISAETRRLAKKAREQGLTVEEMSDGTFTISNLGMFGVDHFTAIINPPQAAILAVGAGQERPVVRDGQLAVGHEMSLTLSADHRLIDGATAAQFLQTLKSLIESPAAMLV